MSLPPVASTGHYLAPEGMPRPVPENDDLDEPYWSALRERRLALQRCDSCGRFQWGPEWICHRCHSFDVGWTDIEPTGVIYSWERPWHPVRPPLQSSTPYLIVLVELPQADNVRLLGNLLGDPTQAISIGAAVHGVFEEHDGYSLLQWESTDM